MSSDIIQLLVRGFKGGTTTIDIHKDAQIADLFRKLEEKTSMKPRGYALVYVKQQISYDHHKDKHLAELHLENGSLLYMVLKLDGGAESVTRLLDDAAMVTIQADMISLEEDPNNKRAKMPCGHGITPDSLTDYCRKLLDEGKYTFQCPWVDANDQSRRCMKEWPYIVVRRMAVLTEAEKREFERKISENFLRKAKNAQECPGCKSLCLRNSDKDIRMRCPVCSKPGMAYDFCWNCLNTWCSRGKRSCGNKYCTGRDPRVDILANAKVKEIWGIRGVPETRACVKCGILIAHAEDCKHMECAACGQEFCFVCLKPRVNGDWQCGDAFTACKVASKQTQLPSVC